MAYGNVLDNVVLRSEKGRPLTIEELDGNFNYLRMFSASLDDYNEAADYASLENGELFSFGNDGKFSLGTGSDGLSLIVSSNFEEDSGDPIFVVKNNANQNVLEVMPDGNIHAPNGEFVIDASQLDGLDLSDFTNLSFSSIALEPFSDVNELPENQASGTLAFAGGELMIKK